MKLDHYLELRKGKRAIVEIGKENLDERSWGHCLVGNFLDGKMPLALLSSTAHNVWDNHGVNSVKQIGSRFIFEFKDEASKISTLENGSYFPPRRYLVFKD